ncbi:MAG: flagellar export protein FliJ [Succinivibrionaceae bacterium]
MRDALSLLYEQLLKKEETARNIYLAAKQTQLNFEKQLDALNQYRSIYSSELSQKGMNSTISNSTYAHYTAFIGRLDTISKEQIIGLQKIKEEVNSKYNDYKAIEAKRKGLESLIEKRSKQKEAFLNKQEQKMSDEFATNRFFAKKIDE